MHANCQVWFCGEVTEADLRTTGVNVSPSDSVEATRPVWSVFYLI